MAETFAVVDDRSPEPPKPLREWSNEDIVKAMDDLDQMLPNETNAAAWLELNNELQQREVVK